MENDREIFVGGQDGRADKAVGDPAVRTGFEGRAVELAVGKIKDGVVRAEVLHELDDAVEKQAELD